jgi:hypothetical protein
MACSFSTAHAYHVAVDPAFTDTIVFSSPLVEIGAFRWGRSPVLQRFRTRRAQPVRLSAELGHHPARARTSVRDESEHRYDVQPGTGVSPPADFRSRALLRLVRRRSPRLRVVWTCRPTSCAGPSGRRQAGPLANTASICVFEARSKESARHFTYAFRREFGFAPSSVRSSASRRSIR